MTSISESKNSSEEITKIYDAERVLDDPSKYPEGVWLLLKNNSNKLSEELQKIIESIESVEPYKLFFRETVCDPIAGETVSIIYNNQEILRRLKDESVIFPKT